MTATQTPRARFEAVFPVIADELLAYMEGEGMPADAVEWMKKVRTVQLLRRGFVRERPWLWPSVLAVFLRLLRVRRALGPLPFSRFTRRDCLTRLFVFSFVYLEPVLQHPGRQAQSWSLSRRHLCPPLSDGRRAH